MDKTQFASDDVLERMHELETQNAELKRKLAAYEAMPVVGWIVRMKTGRILAVCPTKEYAEDYQKAGNFPDLTEVCECVVKFPTTEHLDALLQQPREEERDKYSLVDEAIKLLRDIDACGGLKQGGEQYPNGMCCCDMADMLENIRKGDL